MLAGTKQRLFVHQPQCEIDLSFSAPALPDTSIIYCRGMYMLKRAAEVVKVLYASFIRFLDLDVFFFLSFCSSWSITEAG